MRVAVIAMLGLAACSSTPTDETPTGALRLFLHAMERSDWDDAALEDAYRLLDVDARDELTERASMASSPARSFEPWEMIPQGRFQLRFAPRHMEARVQGGRATVVVTGEGGEPRAEVPMVEEEGRWRVVLAITEAE